MEEILHQLIYIGSLSHYLGVFYIPGGSSGCLPLTVCQNTWCQLSQGTWFAKGPTSQRAHPGNQTLAKKFRWENLNWNVHFCIFCNSFSVIYWRGKKQLHSSTIINQEINYKNQALPNQIVLGQSLSPAPPGITTRPIHL